MSALTKIFVVLLVILSIIQTAGNVVWVNRQENFNTAIKTANAKVAEANARRDASEVALAASQNATTQMRTQMQGQINAAHTEIDQLKATLTDRDTQLAQVNSNLQQVTAANKSANDALQVAQKTLDTTNTQMADLRKQQLDLQNRYAEAVLAINDWTNKYEVANRQWRDSTEQVNQLQGELKQRDELLKRNGITQNTSRDLNLEPLVRVEGVVRAKNNVGGVPMATISVGSADQVSKGMQFKVVDPTSQNPFLGYLTVDRVEPNEAIGHLSGPRVNEVRPGVQVRTQL